MASRNCICGCFYNCCGTGKAWRKSAEKTAELVFLGWPEQIKRNYFVYSIVHCYTECAFILCRKVNLVQPAVIASSKTYEFIKPWGPKAINTIGSLVPLFKDMFQQLEDFFSGLSHP